MTTYTPGDILLVNDYNGGSDLIGNLIRAGERARYGDSDYARWTHSALIVSTDGDLVEALAHGVEQTNISKYDGHETLVISPTVAFPAGKRAYAVNFALAQAGDKYDVLDFIALAMTLLTRCDLSLHSDKHYICSELVARATESYTYDGYPYPAEQMMPADLGDYWHALSGKPLPTMSRIGRWLDTLRHVCWALSPFRTGLRPITASLPQPIRDSPMMQETRR